MKKAMALISLLALLLVTISGCSSPKSEFTSALQKVAANKQYTADVTMKIDHLSDNLAEQLNVDPIGDLTNATLDYSLSYDGDAGRSLEKIDFLFGNQYDLQFETLTDLENGRVYVPVSVIYDTDSSLQSLFSDQINQVLDTVLSNNKDLKDKYLDFYEAMQNITNKTIDQESVKMQAKSMNELQQQVGVAIYDFLNTLEDDRFKTNKDGQVTIELTKQDFTELAKQLTQELNQSDAIVHLIADNNQTSKKEAEKEWQTMKKNLLATFKTIENDNDQSLTAKLIMKPDANKGFSSLKIKLDYQNRQTKENIGFTTDITMQDFQEIPALPTNSQIVTKKELDKAISDGLKVYLSE
ncbi:hypothetical protein [Listeria costaricensis]|uniref:Lmo2079 family surface lipoprotein n=1 Tax=Listeria costaricensis TaxID=2026604 RepID=UPI000C06A79A|nr:hypothetical protein [Listeria costaricensis]